MKFCPDCDNLLMSKDKKFYCKVCDKLFEINPNAKHEYLLVKKVNYDGVEEEPFVVKNDSLGSDAPNEYRKAYEDFFSQSPET